VVDDEAIVRELLTGVLVPNGFEVLEAPNGRTALELYEIHGDTIDVIILDMVMPGMKGDSVLSALEGRLGHVKVIISSGFMSEEQRERLKVFKINAFLDKPYRDKDVLRVMASIFPEGTNS
jgi:CheY-like chemotaxis protein